eukprot:CAMPEP_0178504444 /NCGR_PEP_ID=MMETSP0696-20121128/18597_1 /TAXON_ID=265572 /ORGANISM="Extubocellulus spinifer, Strain CCMP396" /LENGTH=433 /DNA_ID=CAMNT_0020133681 /DNA_START=71 /DNA_END=1372 /DNA_ORIENTATION=-
MNPDVPFEGDSTQRKKAVHVKWAGKTIALGTFPVEEADDKCAQAKALTRTWRSTMRPKPSREWVMLELERRGVRIVSGKVTGGDEGADSTGAVTTSRAGAGGAEAIVGVGVAGVGAMGAGGGGQGGPPPHRPLVGGGAAAAYEAARADHYGSMSEQQNNGAGGSGGIDQQRRLSDMMGGGMGGAGQPPGAGAAGMSSMGSLGVNPNQHYEMLKLHHMNLLNEIQETTLMMNLYQQQHLQQQQQQLQQQRQMQQDLPDRGGVMGQGMSAGLAGASGTSHSLAGVRGGVPLGGGGSVGGNGIGQGVSGAGGGGVQSIGGNPSHQQTTSDQTSQQVHSPSQESMLQKGEPKRQLPPPEPAATSAQEPNETSQKATEDAEEQLRKLKAEIAERERQMKLLEAAAGSSKRKADGEESDGDHVQNSEQGVKRTKTGEPV